MSIENPNQRSYNEVNKTNPERLSSVADTLEQMQSKYNKGREINCEQT